ncbi:MAG: hypothetical protein KGI19_08860 [Thaumarchaeota archaeon]|nr:hypothetical protein [Nitrososphaerota archaeon]
MTLWEDYLLPERIQGNSNTTRQPTIRILDPLGALYTITEIFHFASKIVSSGVYDDALLISIKMHNAENRILQFVDTMRFLHSEYTCRVNDIEVKKTPMIPDLLSNWQDMAIESTIELFELFNWHSPDIIKWLKKDQEEFLTGRFRA